MSSSSIRHIVSTALVRRSGGGGGAMMLGRIAGTSPVQQGTSISCQACSAGRKRCYTSSSSFTSPPPPAAAAATGRIGGRSAGGVAIDSSSRRHFSSSVAYSSSSGQHEDGFGNHEGFLTGGGGGARGGMKNVLSTTPTPLSEKEMGGLLPKRQIPDDILRFKTVTYMDSSTYIPFPHKDGVDVRAFQTNPANFKVSLTVSMKDLNLSEREEKRLRCMIGSRYNTGRQEITLTSNRFMNRSHNQQYLIYLLENLVAEAKGPSPKEEATVGGGGVKEGSTMAA